MKQQCPIAFVYLSWTLLIGGLAYFIVSEDYLAAVVWLVVAPFAQWAYVRTFPATSRFLGYGRVDDRPVEDVSPAPVRVTLYTALTCPFCPIVKRRLEALRDRMGFDLEEVDVTLRPRLLKAKGIKAVPTIEVGKRLLRGHATTEELAAFIEGRQVM